jgi:spermidine synthase
MGSAKAELPQKTRTTSRSQGVREKRAVAIESEGSAMRAWAAALLFLSGMAALIYQVLWVRQLSLVVGLEVYAVTVAVSAFFAGLAIGSAMLGRLSDRWERPLLLYALLEICVAVASVTATIILAHTAAPFVALQARVGVFAWGLPFLLVGGPAFFMGGTLPAVTRWQTLGSSQVVPAAGWLYAANTAGGIAGALMSSFLLIPWLGIRGTAFAAVVLNLGAACAAFALAHGSTSVATAKLNNVAPAHEERSRGSRTALALYGVAGGIALGYEVVWTQAMAQFLSTRVFAFSVVLATYLAGLVLGSAVYTRFAHRLRDPWGTFALLITAAGLLAMLEIACLSLWQLNIEFAAGNLAFAVTHSELARMCARFLVAAFGVVFVPTLMLGAAFPAVIRLTADARHPGRDVGLVLALNTAGGIAGTLLTGFVLVPLFGVVGTLGVLAVGAAAVGAAAVLLGDRVSPRLRWGVCLLGLVAVVVSVATPADRLARLLLTTRGGGELVFYQEARGATVAVAQQKMNDHIFRRLYIQGVSNSGDAMPSLRYMRLQAMLPLLIHSGEPRSALVIGYGTGITAGAVMHYPGLRRRLCVELLPAVVQAGKLFPENYGAGTDPKLDVRIADGRQELLRSPERFDVITLEPPPPSAEGVANLYSTDFYRLASRRLEPNGLFAQWLPIATQNDQDTRSLVRSFLDVFPYATLWTTELDEMLMVGSQAPIVLDAADITRRFAQQNVSISLEAVGVPSATALLATWVTGRDGLERYASAALPVTDDQPRIEYANWVHPKEITQTLPTLMALQTEPPIVHFDDAQRAEFAQRRKTLWEFYAAGIAAYEGNQDRWSQSMQRVFATEGDNPYFRWIAGAS